MAEVYLRRKQYTHRLNSDLMGISVADLAIDCIAGLFERDGDGAFPVLHKYYEAQNWTKLSEEELFIISRRLVFSAVNDQLFLYYSKVDASLSNLLRSLKRACARVDGAFLVRRGGLELVVDAACKDVKPGDCSRPGNDASLAKDGPSTATLPQMPPEFLEAQLTAVWNEGMNVHDLLREIVRIFRSQTLYATRYPLTRIAQVIRSASVRLQVEPSEQESATDTLEREDLVRLIDQSVSAAQITMQPGYVGARKVSETIYRVYFEAIRERLKEQFVQETGESPTNFGVLQSFLPQLSLQTYREEHRAVFEYLSKTTRTGLLQRLREDFDLQNSPSTVRN